MVYWVEKLKVSRTEIDNAKEMLKEYPKLNKIFENFKDYSEPSLDYNNKVFLLCYWSESDTLRKIEDGLSIFNSWDFSRLCDKDYNQSGSAVDELLIAYEIGNRIGFENVCLEKPFNGKKPDIFVELNNVKIIIELTSLNDEKYRVNIVLGKIWTGTRNAISESFEKSDFYLELRVNTSKLPRNYEHELDERKSVEFLMDWIRRLRVFDLVNTQGLIWFRGYADCFSWVRAVKKEIVFLGEIVDDTTITNNPSCQDELTKIRSDGYLRNWANGVKIVDIENSPFDYVSFRSNNSGKQTIMIRHQDPPCLETTEIASMDKSLEMEMAGIKNRLRRTIEEKKNRRQRQKGDPAILFIRVKEDVLFLNEFEGLGKFLLNELTTHSWCSGILLFSKSYENGSYFMNPNPEKGVALQPSVLNSLGITKIWNSP